MSVRWTMSVRDLNLGCHRNNIVTALAESGIWRVFQLAFRPSEAPQIKGIAKAFHTRLRKALEENGTPFGSVVNEEAREELLLFALDVRKDLLACKMRLEEARTLICAVFSVVEDHDEILLDLVRELIDRWRDKEAQALLGAVYKGTVPEDILEALRLGPSMRGVNEALLKKFYELEGVGDRDTKVLAPLFGGDWRECSIWKLVEMSWGDFGEGHAVSLTRVRLYRALGKLGLAFDMTLPEDFPRNA